MCSGEPKPEIVGGSVKPLVYRQWQLSHVTLVKWVNTTASIRTIHCRSFHKIQNVLSENLKFWGRISRQSFHNFVFILYAKVPIR